MSDTTNIVGIEGKIRGEI